MTALLFVAMFLLISHLQGGLRAYLDPGTGSIAIQLVLGGLVAAFATAKLYWDRLKAFVRRRPARDDGAPEAN
jgi:hypothetical protein